ncbi:MAG: serine hydrolase domain-containing protein [Chloroflexota bacterium]
MSSTLRLHPNLLIPLLEQRIPEMMTKNAVPGLSAALFHESALVWSRGYGVRNTVTQQPVTTQTIFEAASLSKPVVAYAALHLVTRGVLLLDRPLATYLPEVQHADEPDLAPITLRHVLSHSTGLPNWRPRGQPLRRQFEPGERFAYSGEGYVYLQRVIEYLTGQSLGDFMQKQILDPLGMQASGYIWRPEYVDNAADGHESDGSPVEKGKPDDANAAYTLHTTAEDFARFMLAALHPPEAALISNSFRDAMLMPQIEVTDPVTWGLGWGLCDDSQGKSFWHWGDNTWFTCFAAGWREPQSGLVLMTNSVFGLQACRDILAAALGADYPAFPGLMNSFYRNP